MNLNASQIDALRLPMQSLNPGLWTLKDEARFQDLLKEKARRRRDEALRYFAPNPAQKRFVDEIAREGRFIVVNGGGNGEGKTYILIATLGAFMWPALAPACFQAPIFQNFPYPKRIWIISNPSELGKTGAIQPTIDKLWPANKFKAEKDGHSYNSIFHSDTGWEVALKSTEQAVREFRGANVGVIAINEPPPEDIFNESLARLRMGGLVIGAMTSLDDEPWVVDGILEKHDGKDYRIVYGNVEENCKDHTPGGTLSHDQIEKILSKFPADEQEARRTGKPLSLSGRIFKSFDRSIHVLKDEVRPRGDVSIVQVIDPAGGKPFAIQWAYADAGGNVTIFDEWPNTPFFGAKDPGLSISDYVDVFKVKEANLLISRRIMDRRYGNTSHKPGALTIREEFAQHGLDFENSYQVGEDLPEVQTGILNVYDYLKFDKSKPMDSVNKPMLFISPNCRNTIESLAKWTRDPKTMKPRDNHYKDFCDCTRYLVMAKPKFETEAMWADRGRPGYGVNNG